MTTLVPTGHSADWVRAYRTAAPEDTAQRDVVRQLALSIRADQTAEQARRVEALRARITLLRPLVAGRLYARLTRPSDPLGRLFRLTLHRATVASLLAQLDAKRRTTDPATPPPRPTATSTPRPPDPGKPPQRPAPGWPPPWRPPRQPVVRQPPVLPQEPMPPWMPPGVETLPGDRPAGWSRRALTAGASALGTVLSVGLRAVSSGAMEKGLEAAWLVFQITEEEPAALIGMAGEAAAEAFLAEALGLDPTALVNLNTVMPNFPVVDLIGSSFVGSVKARGVLSTLPAAALTRQLRSQYTSDLLSIITGEKKLAKAAQALLDHRTQLGRAWPRDLRARTVEGVSRYLRDKTLLLVPSDHVQPLRKTLGEDLYRRLVGRKQVRVRLGLTDDTLFAAYVDAQVDRIVSMGPSSTDLRVMAETAANHLPADVTARWRDKFADILRRTIRRARP